MPRGVCRTRKESIGQDTEGYQSSRGQAMGDNCIRRMREHGITRGAIQRPSEPSQEKRMFLEE